MNIQICDETKVIREKQAQYNRVKMVRCKNVLKYEEEVELRESKPIQKIDSKNRHKEDNSESKC